MSLWSKLSGRIRSLTRGDKEQVRLTLAKGATGSSMPGSTHDLLQSYGYDVVADYLRLEQDLMSRYIDYESMDDYDLLGTALDVYADDSTQPDTPTGRRVWVSSPDKDVEQLLNDFLHRQIRIDEEIWSIARCLCKYGNCPEEIVLHPEEGVIGLNHLPPHTMRRIEGPRGELYGFVQDFNRRIGYSPKEFHQLLSRRLAKTGAGNLAPNEHGGGNKLQIGSQAIAFEGWQVAHGRIRSKQRRSIYGHSVLESTRWTWKRLVLLEDSALIYRVQRAPERYAFYVDTGSLPQNEAKRLFKSIVHNYKKKKFVNPSTNEIDLKFETIAPMDDIFLPVVDGAESTRVELLGGPNWQHMDDVEYFLRKMLTTLKIPRAYLSYEESVNRSILSQEDVRFARTILRIQQVLREMIHKICRVHLAAVDIPPNRVEFRIHMTVPSALFEMAQIEVKNARADLMSRMREHVSLSWVLRNIWGMSDEEAETILDQRDEERVREGKIQGKAEAQMQKALEPEDQGRPPENLQPGTSWPPQESRQSDRPLLMGRLQGSGAWRKGLLPGSPLAGISERDKYGGDRESRESEKRAEQKLDTLLLQDRAMQRRLTELRGLVMDLSRRKDR